MLSFTKRNSKYINQKLIKMILYGEHEEMGQMGQIKKQDFFQKWQV